LNIQLKYIVHLVDCEMLRSSYSEIKQCFDEEVGR